LSKIKIVALVLGAALVYGYAPAASAAPWAIQLTEAKAVASHGVAKVCEAHRQANNVVHRTTTARRVVRRNNHY
jgi:hypothetical protein